MENVLWKQNVANIKKSIWIYTICGLLSSLFILTDELINVINVGSLAEYMSLSDESPDVLTVWLYISYAFYVPVIIGLVLFSVSINKFSKLQISDKDTLSVLSIRKANNILISCLICFLVCIIVVFSKDEPVSDEFNIKDLIYVIFALVLFIAFLVSVVYIVIAYVKQYKGYSGLSHSDILSTKAKSGANLLRVCVIWTIVAAFIVIIPLLGSFISLVISLVVFFKVLQGWTMIAEGAPEVYDSNEVK